MLPLLLIPGMPCWFCRCSGAAWLNQRAFRFDALAEHATRDEMQLLVREDGRSFYMAGLATGRRSLCAAAQPAGRPHLRRWFSCISDWRPCAAGVRKEA
jgi:hypothetical protein